MSGKLPIDRVRETKDRARPYEIEIQTYTEDQAPLRDTALKQIEIQPDRNEETVNDDS